MPKRRNQIEMTPEEQDAFLREGHTLQVASIGPRGYPHLVAMWYALVDGKVCFTTYAKSQKVLNLRRNPKISVMLETGRPYNELRGLVVEGEAEIVDDDPELAAKVMMISGSRRPGEPPAGPPTPQTLRAVAKRVVVRVNPVYVYSWDHRKLGGAD
ncbi:MAG TPA: pyridoxamine 5'-phosphate oxidase family protein [Dehalococcoidia bacterium]|nr:pyridoxamine 5'-phosphate oxidase family protein [Dehalococcoidia bacterium]